MVQITHSTVVVVPDDGTSPVGTDEWNDDHVVTVSAASRLAGRGSASGAGALEEITIGTNLTMTGTTLSSSGATGPTGPAGADGDQIFVQTSAPSTSNPEGSIWIDSDSTDLDLYRLTGGAWVDTSTNLKGAPGGTPAGSDTHIQYNDAGSFGAEAGLTYDKTTNTLGGVDQWYIPTGASGFNLNTTNPLIHGDPNFRRAMEVHLHYEDPQSLDPAYGTVTAQSLVVTAMAGQNTYSDEIQAKATYMCQYNVMNGYAAGQKFNQVHVVNGWGMGDVANSTSFCNFASGPVAGDEGIGFTLVNNLEQSRGLHISTISSVPTPATITTTTTQAITASRSEQTVAVASSTGASAGQWVNVGVEPMNIEYNGEVVQITSVPDATHIRGIFRNHHANGVSVIWVPVIVVDHAEFFGEGRTLVNTSSATTYSTGTLASSPWGSSQVLGSGTSWSATMVGGTAFNVGAISFDQDTYTGVPFNGTGSAGPLRDWYQIVSVTNATTLDLWSMSVAADQSYLGKATTGGTYIIRPAARVMKRLPDGQTLVLERSAHTWTAGDTVECAICPFPDISGRQDHFAVYTAGGVRRAFYRIVNQGRSQFQNCIQIDSNRPAGADALAFGNCISLGAECDVGLMVGSFCASAAIQLPSAQLNSSKIIWQAIGIEIGWDATAGGMFIQGCGTNPVEGCLRFIDEGTHTSGQAVMSFPGLIYAGGVKVTTKTVGTLPTPSADNRGTRYMVSDANATTFWSVVAGGGANIIPVTSDGTNWRIG